MTHDRAIEHAGPAAAPARPDGRLRLLAPAELTDEQRVLHRDLLASRGRHGYAITDEDDRLIGPFNALLRVPPVAAAQLRWVEAIGRSGIDPMVREAVILTIAGRWRLPYMLYAHRRAALRVGLDATTITALTSGTPIDDGSDVGLAAVLTLQVAVEHRVADPTYRRCVGRFGETTLTVLMTLIGQYLTTAALLTCFDVPAPEPAEEGNP